VKISILTNDDKINMTVRILKVDETKRCIEFSRTSGSQMEFFNTFKAIKDYFDQMANAVL